MAFSVSSIHQITLKVIPMILFATVVVVIVVVWTLPSTSVRMIFKTMVIVIVIVLGVDGPLKRVLASGIHQLL